MYWISQYLKHKSSSLTKIFFVLNYIKMVYQELYELKLWVIAAKFLEYIFNSVHILNPV
jgi:hypothetical protein